MMDRANQSTNLGDIGVAFTANYFYSERRRLHRQRDVLSDRLR
jgi:hypothetical protein